MVLNATVNQVDAEKLRLGMKANIHLDAYPDLDLPGVLDGIGAMSKTSTFRAGYVGAIPIRIKIEKMDPRVIPDLTGSAEVILAAEQQMRWSCRARQYSKKTAAPSCFVQSPQGWVKKKVEPGLASFTQVAIQSGVEKGATW